MVASRNQHNGETMKKTLMALVFLLAPASIPQTFGQTDQRGQIETKSEAYDVPQLTPEKRTGPWLPFLGLVLALVALLVLRRRSVDN